MSSGPYIVDETCLVFAKNIEEENERLRAENEKLRDAYDIDALTISYNLGYSCGKDIANDEIERLRAENEKLREALKPFADDAVNFWSDVLETPNGSAVGVDVADLRAAAAAIRESGDE